MMGWGCMGSRIKLVTERLIDYKISFPSFIISIIQNILIKLFFPERLNHVEPRVMVESKRINISRDRLLNPWIYSPLSKYKSSLMHHV